MGGGGSTGSGNSLRTSRGSSSPMSSSASASPSAASHAGRGSTSSVRSSGCSNMHNSSRYHMHPHEWAEAELRLFYRLLAAVVEDRISGDTAASEGNPNVSYFEKPSRMSISILITTRNFTFPL